MLKSKARGPVGRKAAVAGVVSAGVLLGGMPAMGALQPATATVSYTCTPMGGGDAVAPDLAVTLQGNPLTVAPSQAVTLAWSNSQDTVDPTKQIKAPAAGLQPTDDIVMVGELVITGPAPNETVTIAATATSKPQAPIAANSPVPLPTVTATVTPTVSGTLAAKADKFTLKFGQVSGSEVSYTCVVNQGGPHPAPASIAITVGPGTSASPTPTPTATPTPTLTPTPTPTQTPTPRGTRTVYETVTAGPSKTPVGKGQVTHTPKGGVDTGGGGEMGPDARVLILTGTGLMLAAASGGLVLRARRRTVRQ